MKFAAALLLSFLSAAALADETVEIHAGMSVSRCEDKGGSAECSASSSSDLFKVVLTQAEPDAPASGVLALTITKNEHTFTAQVEISKVPLEDGTTEYLFSVSSIAPVNKLLGSVLVADPLKLNSVDYRIDEWTEGKVVFLPSVWIASKLDTRAHRRKTR